jgi:hypothetical protein
MPLNAWTRQFEEHRFVSRRIAVNSRHWARIEEIVAAASPDSMREREKNGKNGIDPKFNFIGPAKVKNWKQLHSGDDRDAISILEEFARDAMQRGGYESSAALRVFRTL